MNLTDNKQVLLICKRKWFRYKDTLVQWQVLRKSWSVVRTPWIIADQNCSIDPTADQYRSLPHDVINWEVFLINARILIGINLHWVLIKGVLCSTEWLSWFVRRRKVLVSDRSLWQSWILEFLVQPWLNSCASLRYWKEQLAWPSARMRQNYNFQWKSPTFFSTMFCGWNLVEISMWNFTSASFWQRVASTAPLKDWLLQTNKSRVPLWNLSESTILDSR